MKSTPLSARDVGGIIQFAGTFLGSARSAEFATPARSEEAVRQLQALEIESVIVIGGNGSQQGAHALSDAGLRVAGVASTIDNDLTGSDVTIGVDTALNIALEAIDRLRVTASSHHRGLLVEVMGRRCGYLALMAGLAGGAEAIVIPERELDPETHCGSLRAASSRGKKCAIIVVAEGARNNAERLTQYFQNIEIQSRLRAPRNNTGSRAARRHSYGFRPPAWQRVWVSRPWKHWWREITAC